jgi:hypothetical protein
MNRRDIFKSGFFLSLSSLFSLSPANSVESKEQNSATGVESLYLLGSSNNTILKDNYEATRFKGAKIHSILSKINLKTRKSFVKPLAITKMHAMGHLDSKRIIALSSRGTEPRLYVINPETLEVLKKVSLPKGFGPSGHFHFNKKLKEVVVPLSHKLEKDYSKDVKGILLVLDSDSLKVKKQIQLNGVSPHDITYLPMSDQYAISFYGQKIKNPKESSSINTIKNSKVILYKAKTLEQTDEIKQIRNEHFFHLVSDDLDQLYLITIEPANKNQAGLAEVLKRTKSKKSYFNFSKEEQRRTKISLPTAFYVYDTKNKKLTTVIDKPALHRRPQSIFYHQQSDQVVATYAHSNAILVYGTQTKKVKYITGFELGLTDVRGIAGDDSRIYISDFYNGISVLDTSLKVIDRINVKTFESIHLFSSRS